MADLFRYVVTDKLAIELGRILEGKIKDGNYINSIVKKLTNKNLKVVKFLDRGSFGAAYLLSDGAVLKATFDSSEAKACATVVGKKNKYIVDIYAVGKVNKKADFMGLKSIWFIHREFISRDFTLVQKKIARLLTKFQNSYDLNGERTLLGKKGIEEMTKFWCTKGRTPSEKNVCRETVVVLARIIKEMKDKGIRGYKDFHIGNLGVKNGNLCVFDLGFEAKSRGGKIKKIQANGKIIKKIISELKDKGEFTLAKNLEIV